VADDRVLATVLFTDIVDSTRRAAEMGDRDWHRFSMRTMLSSVCNSIGFGVAR
jgi:class 3 adenylate cyclase